MISLKLDSVLLMNGYFVDAIDEIVVMTMMVMAMKRMKEWCGGQYIK